MAREVITSILCDICLDSDIRTPGEETPPISVGGRAPRVLALCKEEHWEVYEGFLALLQEAPTAAQLTGAPAAGHEPKVMTYPCPHCSKGYMKRSSLNSHLNRRHPEEAGEEPQVVDDEPFVCDVMVDGQQCGETYTGPRKSQSLGVHKRMKHGIAGPNSKPAP